jgi:hypothetical protein
MGGGRIYDGNDCPVRFFSTPDPPRFSTGQFYGGGHAASEQRANVFCAPDSILSWGTLLVRYFASANATRVMMWGAVLSFGANVSFNYLLMRPLGVVGISLSTSIVYFLSFAFLLFMLKRIRMEAA